MQITVTNHDLYGICDKANLLPVWVTNTDVGPHEQALKIAIPRMSHLFNLASAIYQVIDHTEVLNEFMNGYIIDNRMADPFVDVIWPQLLAPASWDLRVRTGVA